MPGPKGKDLNTSANLKIAPKSKAPPVSLPQQNEIRRMPAPPTVTRDALGRPVPVGWKPINQRGGVVSPAASGPAGTSGINRGARDMPRPPGPVNSARFSTPLSQGPQLIKPTDVIRKLVASQPPSRQNITRRGYEPARPDLTQPFVNNLAGEQPANLAQQNEQRRINAGLYAPNPQASVSPEEAAKGIGLTALTLAFPVVGGTVIASQNPNNQYAIQEAKQRFENELQGAIKSINEPVTVYKPGEGPANSIPAKGGGLLTPGVKPPSEITKVEPNILQKGIRTVQQVIEAGLGGLQLSGEAGKRLVLGEALKNTPLTQPVILPGGQVVQPTVNESLSTDTVKSYAGSPTVYQEAQALYGADPRFEEAWWNATRAPASALDLNKGVDAGVQLRVMARMLTLNQDAETALYGDGDYVASTLMDLGWADDPIKAIQADPNAKYVYDVYKAQGLTDEQIVALFNTQGLPGESDPIKEALAEIAFDPLNLAGGFIDDAVEAGRLKTAEKMFSPSAITPAEALAKQQAAYKGAVNVFGKVIELPNAPLAYTPAAVVDNLITKGGDALHAGLVAAVEGAGKEGRPGVQAVITALLNSVEAAPEASKFANAETYAIRAAEYAARQEQAAELLKQFPMLQSEAGKLGGLLLRQLLTNDEGIISAAKLNEILGDGTKPKAQVWAELTANIEDAAKALLLPERKGATNIKQFVEFGGEAAKYPTFERGALASVERVKTAKQAAGAGLNFEASAFDYLVNGIEAVRSKINSGLWNIFAGTNPAVTSRNALNNALTAIVDGGFSLGSGQDVDKALNILFDPAAAARGIGASGDLKAGFGMAGNAKLGGIPIGMQAVEAEFSKRIVAKQGMETLDKLMQYGKAIPEMGSDLKAAFGDDLLNGLVRQLQLSHGDTDAALAWLETQKGGVELWRQISDGAYTQLSKWDGLAEKADDILKTATSTDDLRAKFATLAKEYQTTLAEADDAIPAFLDENVEEFSTWVQDSKIVKQVEKDVTSATETVVNEFEQTVKVARENRLRAQQAAQDFMNGVADDGQFRTLVGDFQATQRELAAKSKQIVGEVDALRTQTWRKYNDIKKLKIDPTAKSVLADELWRDYFNFRNDAWEGYTADFEKAWVDWRYGHGEFDISWPGVDAPIKPEEFRPWVQRVESAIANGVDFTPEQTALLSKMKGWISQEDAWRAQQEAANAFATRYENFGQVKMADLKKFFNFTDGTARPKGFQTAYRFAPGSKASVAGEANWIESVVEMLRQKGITIADDVGEEEITKIAQTVYDLTQQSKGVKPPSVARPATQLAADLGLPPAPRDLPAGLPAGFQAPATAEELAAMPPIKPTLDQAGLFPPASNSALPPGAVSGGPAFPGAVAGDLGGNASNLPLYGQNDPRGIPQLLNSVLTDALNKWGQTKPFGLTDTAADSLKAWAELTRARVLEARTIAGQVGVEARNFSLLNYSDRRNLDLWLAYVYPYHYFYGRTYLNWVKRAVQNPAALAGYGRYRDALDQLHAGLPDYWKQQISTAELGLGKDHPLYFNLEQSLNPIYGLTGEDYSDPVRRRAKLFGMADAGGLAEDMQNAGPTLWTPIGWALALSNFDDPEAALAWSNNYLSGAAKATRSATALVNQFAGKDIFPAGGVNIDPQMFIANALFGGGPSATTMTEWERRRVASILTSYLNKPPAGMNPLDWQAKLKDAAYVQKGPLWDKAMQEMFAGTAPGVLTSYAFGLGFKGRSVDEIKFDQIYQEQANIRAHLNEWSPEQISQAWLDLNNKYPEAGLLSLARTPGAARDDRWLWEAVGRVGVGNYGVWEELGVSKEALDAFYANKTTEGLDPIYYDELIGAALAINARMRPKTPEEAQRQLDARASWNDLQDVLTGLGGEELEAGYYANDDPEARSQYLANLSEENRALLLSRWDTRQQWYTQNPALAPYYADAEKYQDYLIGKFYDEMETKYPEVLKPGGIRDAWRQADKEGNFELKRRITEKYPQLIEFFDAQGNFYDNVLNQETEKWLTALPETEQFTTREDTQAVGFDQNALDSYLAEQQAGITPGATGTPPAGGGTPGTSVYDQEAAALEAENAAEVAKAGYITTDNKEKFGENWLGPLVENFGQGSEAYYDAPLVDQWKPYNDPLTTLDNYVGENDSIRAAIMVDGTKAWTRVVAGLMQMSDEELAALARSDPRYKDAVIVAQQAKRYDVPNLNALLDILGLTASVQEDGTYSLTRKKNLDDDKGYGGSSAGTGNGGTGNKRKVILDENGRPVRENWKPLNERAYYKPWMGQPRGRGARRSYGGSGDGGYQPGVTAPEVGMWQNFAAAFGGENTGAGNLLTLLMDYFDLDPYNRQMFLQAHPELAAILQRPGLDLAALEAGYKQWNQQTGRDQIGAELGQRGNTNRQTIQRFYQQRGSDSGL